MMKEYIFTKNGITFCFKNPKWDEFSKTLKMEWKILNIAENKENNGYYRNSTFMSKDKAMRIALVVLNDNRKINAVKLPDNIFEEIQATYEKMYQEYIQNKLNMDIKYTLNDTTAYGIYNGISEFDIALIVKDIKKQLNTSLYIPADEIAKTLTKDPEIKQIAMESYQPLSEGNWNEDYLNWFRKAVKEKKAPGYGLIPNKIIRKKITEIIINKIEKENNRVQERKEKISKLLELAKETGEKQLIQQWSEPCNDKNEECDLDICFQWAMPDGTTKVTKIHTY